MSVVVLPEPVGTGGVLRPSSWVAGLVETLRSRGHTVVPVGRSSRDARDLLPAARPALERGDPAGDDLRSEVDLLPQAGELSRRLAEEWKAEPPDVVAAVGCVSGLVALAGARDVGLPIVQVLTGLSTESRAAPLEIARLEPAVARSAAAVVTTDTDSVSALVRHGVARRSITTIPCGVDVSMFVPDGEALLEPGPTRLLAVTGPDPADWVLSLIEAMPLIPRAELVVAGTSSTGSVRLRAAAERAGVGGRLQTLGRLPYADMPALYRSCTILIALSRHDPLARTALEAMACGLPVVASSSGALNDVVVAGSTGVLVPPGATRTQLAATLRRLVTDSVALGAYSISGVDRARSRYAWDRVTSDLEAVLARSVTSSGARTFG